MHPTLTTAIDEQLQPLQYDQQRVSIMLCHTLSLAAVVDDQYLNQTLLHI
jgi:hypothetical protein